jgi:hypothetical protein
MLGDMSSEPPREPPTEVAPPRYTEPAGYPQGPPPERGGHAGPWILAAAVVLVLGALTAVLVHNADTSDTQTVITRSPTVNTTQVQRTGPTVTQATTTVAPTRTTTVTEERTVTSPANTTTTTTSP